MNKIFKVIWHHATQSWVVTSELSKAHGKTASTATAGESNLQINGIYKAGFVYTAIASAILMVSGQAFATNPPTGSNGYTQGTDNYCYYDSDTESVLCGDATTNTVHRTDNKTPKSVIVGKGATNTGESNVAVGISSSTGGTSSVAVGDRAKAKANQTVAIGQEAQGNSDWDISIGRQAGFNAQAPVPTSGNAEGRNIAIGDAALKDGLAVNNNIAMGTSAAQSMSGSRNVVLGTYANATEAISTAKSNGSTEQQINFKTRQVDNKTVEYIEVDNTVAIGHRALSTKIGATAVGQQAKAFGTTSTAVGNGTRALGDNSIAVGNTSNAGANGAIAIGLQVNYDPDQSVAANKYKTTGGNSIAIGYRPSASANHAIAIGSSSKATKNGAVAVGPDSVTNGVNAVAVGQVSHAEGQNSFAAGNDSHAIGKSAVAIGDGAGKGAMTTEEYKAGNYANAASGESSTAVGPYTKAAGQGATAVGYSANAKNVRAVAVGAESSVLANQGIAIGDTAKVEENGLEAVPAGRGTYTVRDITSNDAIAIGNRATSRGTGSVAVGAHSETRFMNATAVGNETKALGYNSTAMGFQALAKGVSSIAIGDKALAGQQGDDYIPIANRGIAIGVNSNATGETAVTVGSNADVKVSRGTALGVLSQVTQREGVALGAYSVANRDKGQTGADPLSARDARTAESAWVATHAAVSVGNDVAHTGQRQGNSANVANWDMPIVTRQITNVAAGTQDTDAVNVAQLKAAGFVLNTAADGGNATNSTPAGATGTADNKIANGESLTLKAGKGVTLNQNGSEVTIKTAYYSVNTTDQTDESNFNNDGAKAIDSVAAGVRVKTTQKNSVAIGSDALADGAESLALGNKVKAIGLGATAIGNNSKAEAEGAQAFGQSSVATGLNSAAIGRFATASGARSSAFGVGNTASGVSSFAGGDKSVASGERSIAVGLEAKSTHSNTIAIGSNAVAQIEDSIAIGRGVTTEILPADNALPNNGEGDREGMIAIGSETTKASGKAAVSIGRNAQGIGRGTVALGDASKALEGQGVAVGAQAKVLKGAAGGIAIGSVAQSEKRLAIAIGSGSQAKVEESVALGTQSVADVVKGKVGADLLQASAEKNNSTWTSTHAAVSVGNGTTVTRQITSVAAGTQDTDAVNVAQLKASGFKLAASHSEGGEHTTVPDDKIQNGETVTVDAGKNIKVTHTANQISIATVETPKFGNVTINDNGKITGVANGSVAENSQDAVNGSQLRNTAGDIANIIGGDAAVDDQGDVTATNIGGTGANNINDAIKTTKTTVKSTDKSIKVTTNTPNATDGTVFDISVNAQGLAESAQLPVVYTTASGDKVTKQPDGKFYLVNPLTGLPTQTEVKPGDVIASMQNGVGDTTVPMSLSNIASNLPDTTKTVLNTPVTAQAAPTFNSKQLNNAATVADVLNAGFNLQTNDRATDFVRAYDTLNFKNGVNTKVRSTTDNTTTNIFVDVVGLPIQYTTTDGRPVAKVGDEYYALDENGVPCFKCTKPGEFVASVINPQDGGPKTAGSATKLANVQGNLQQVTADGQVNNPNGTEVEAASLDNLKTGPQTAEEIKALRDTPKSANYAATLGDVLNSGWNLQGNGAAKDFVRHADTVNFVDGTGTTVEVETTADGTTSTVKVNTLVELVDAEGNPVKKAKDGKFYKASEIDASGNPTAGATEVAKPQVNLVNPTVAADRQTKSLIQLGNVDKGTKDTDAVNVSQLKGAVDALGGGAGFNLDGSVKAPSYSLTDPTSGTVSTVNNVGDALTHLNTSVNKPFVFVGDVGTFDRKLGQTTTVKGGVISEAELSNSNIGVVAKDGTLEIKLAKDVNVDSVVAGGTKIDSNGLTFINANGLPVDNSPSISKTGINAGNQKITSVAKGTDDTDAVNVAQLKEVDAKAGVKTKVTAGEGVDVTNKGTAEAPNYEVALNQATKDSLAKADSAVQGIVIKAEGNQVKELTKDNNELNIKGDANISVTNDNGEVKVALNKDVTGLDSLTSKKVTAGEGPNQVVLDNKGVNVGGKTYISDAGLNANDKKITNVADGAVTVDSKDAVNGSQLRNTAGDIANIIGGNAVVDDQGNVTASNIGDTGAANINDAIKTVKTTVKSSDNTIKVTTNTANPNEGTVFDISVDAQKLAESAQLPVVYTDKNGNKVYKVNGKFTKDPTGVDAAQVVPNADVIASMQSADGSTTDPTTLANVQAGKKDTDAVNVSQLKGAVNALGGGAGFNTDGSVKAPTYNITNPADGSTKTVNNVGDALSSLNDAVNSPLSFGGDTGADVTRKLGQKVSVVGGVTDETKLSSGNIGVVANGNDKLEVKLAKDLTGLSSAQFQDAAGNTTTVNSNGVTITPANQADPTKVVSLTKDGLNNGGNVISNVANGAETFAAPQVNGEKIKLANDGKWYKESDVGANGKPTDTATAIDPEKAKKALGTAGNGGLADFANSNPNNAATVGDLQNLGFVIGTADDKYKDQVRNNSRVEFAGDNKNVKVTGSTLADGTRQVKVTVSDNPVFDKVQTNTVQVGGAAGPVISATPTGDLKVAKPNGSAARITNVAPGVNGTDAVNVNQLKQGLGDINNRITKTDKNLRGGIAGSNAAAGLPQVYLPGKSMVAAAAGTYKGESAVAVGYSRASDNGKVILKLQGNANTRGDFGGSVGVGYQW